MKFYLIIFLVLIASATYAKPNQNALPDLEDYGRLPEFSSMAVSPSGDVFAFRKIEKGLDQIIIYSIKERKIVGAVDVSSIDPNRLFFQSEYNLILVASQHKKLLNYRESMDLSTAYSYDYKKRKIEPLIKLGEELSRGRFIYLGQTGMGRILGQTSDQEYLFMPAFVAENDMDQSPDYSLLKVKSNGKGRPKVYSGGNRDVTDYFLDDKGNVLARESFDEKANKHKLEAKHNKEWVAIYEHKGELKTHSFMGLTQDFKKIIFVAIEKENDRNSYFTMSLADGATERLPYARDDADIESLIMDNNRVVIGVKYTGFTPTYKFFNQNTQNRVDKILEMFSENTVDIIDWSADRNNLLVYVEGSSYAGDYYYFVKGEKPKRVASSRPAIKPQDINPIGTVNYKARDGRIIPTLVTIPAKHLDNMKNLPAVLFPHGGPAAYDKIGFDFMAQALASRGYLVIQPQFRGSNGFGYEHEKAGHGEWGGKMQDDLTDAVAFFSKKGMIDSERICIVGASYGGYAALAGAAFTADLYKCAVSIAGVSHLPKLLKSDKSRYGKHSEVIAYLKKAIGGGDFNNQELKDKSPYYHADKIKIPVLLIHGVDDKVVDYNQSKIMYSALRKGNAATKLVKLKHEDHYLRDSETRFQALQEMVQFVESNIGKK